MEYPSLFYTRAILLKNGRLIGTDLVESYRLLNLAIDGYNYQVNYCGFKQYEKVLKDAKKLAQDSIYAEAKKMLEEISNEN